jgi:molybdenum cofactor biosynthesis protein A
MRLAVTDRCNLRCFYCMPEKGIDYVQRSELLTFEEMERLVRISSALGITKLRLTGGEPFVRQGIMGFLEKLSLIDDLKHIHITTNGTFTKSYVSAFKDLKIQSVNLSLDTLDKQRFFQITRRNLFDVVWDTFHALLDAGIETKINMVVMLDKNIDDIYPMIELTRNQPVSMRFIEEMPFNGTPGQGNATFWPAKKILEHIQLKYPETIKLVDPDFSTAENYQVPGYLGNFGIIAAFTRTFCGTCNRIRVTPQGELKTCLYDHGKVNLRDSMRSGMNDQQLAELLKSTLQLREKDGFEAEANRKLFAPVSESMSTIGG